MTLIVGILCSDGVVMASDSAATFSTVWGDTIRQSMTKLQVIADEHLLVGYSGAVGISQLITQTLNDMWSQKTLARLPAPQWMSAISQQIVKVSEHLRVTASQAGPRVSPYEVMETHCHTLLAGSPQEKPCLIRFNSLGAPEMATSDLPFVAIGSGQAIADPFLAFVRRIFWPSGLPSLAQGTFMATWTLDHAIKTHPGGVGGAIQLGIVEKTKKGDFRGRIVPEEERAEHEQNVVSIEDYLSKYQAPSQASAPPPELARQFGME